MRKYWIALSSLLVVALAHPRCFYPGPELRHRLPRRHRGRGRVQEAGRRRGASATPSSRAGFSTPDVVQVVDPTNPNHFLIRVQDVSVVDEADKEKLKKALCLTEDPRRPSPTRRRAPPTHGPPTSLAVAPGTAAARTSRSRANSRPRLSIKVAWFLSDVSRAGGGTSR